MAPALTLHRGGQESSAQSVGALMKEAADALRALLAALPANHRLGPVLTLLLTQMREEEED